MYYLKSLLPTLALAGSIDALAVKRHNNAAPAAPAGSASGCTCSQGQAAAVNIAATSVDPNASATATGAQGATAGAGAGAKAIYFMTNQDENSVIMLPVQADGTLAAGSIIATGGEGASLIDAMTGQPAKTDTLASQGAVRVVGSSLFAVNPGSNSLSMFAIDPQDPAKLSAVGQAVSTGGDVFFVWHFPHFSVSITNIHSRSSQPQSPPQTP